MGRCITLVFLTLASSLWSQEPVRQNIFGRVLNAESGFPVEDVLVSIRGKETVSDTFTNSSGQFHFENIPIGLIDIVFTDLQYDTVKLIRQQLSTAKALQLEVLMTPGTYLLREVVLRSPSYDPTIFTQLSVIKPEEAEYYAATFYDPARAVALQSGAVILNDQANEISLYGLNPDFNRWQLEGHEITNPNHLSNAGTFSDKPSSTGGGVIILSQQILDHSIFRESPLPFGMGNALGGILDMRLRKGNPHTFEKSAKASLLGLEFAAEGPFSNEHEGSFLFNARYSTVGLLSDLGVDLGDEKIHFADAAFHMHWPWKNGRSEVQFFGMGGFSSNLFEGPEDPAEFEDEKDLSTIDYEDNNGLLGMNLRHTMGKKSLLNAGIAYSRAQRAREEERIDLNSEDILLLYDKTIEGKFSSFIDFQTQFNPSLNLTGGLRFIASNLNAQSRISGNGNLDWMALPDLYEFRPFAALDWRLNDEIELSIGVDIPVARYLGVNFAPAIQIQYQPTGRLELELEARRQFQVPPLWLFTHFTDSVGFSFLRPDHMRSDQAAFLVGVRISDRVLSKTRIFYNRLSAIPSAIAFPGFTLAQRFGLPVLSDFVSEGSLRNYGVSQQVQFDLERSWYGLFSFAVYESEYRAFDDFAWSPSQFDNGYSGTAMVGKAFYSSRNPGRRSFGFNISTIFRGGLKEAQIDIPASENSPFTVFDYSQGFINQLGSYFRIDLQLYMEKNKEKTSSRLSLDIQNVLNLENDAFRYYDHYLQNIIIKKQLGIIPLLSYQIDF